MRFLLLLLAFATPIAAQSADPAPRSGPLGTRVFGLYGEAGGPGYLMSLNAEFALPYRFALRLGIGSRPEFLTSHNNGHLIAGLHLAPLDAVLQPDAGLGWRIGDETGPYGYLGLRLLPRRSGFMLRAGAAAFAHPIDDVAVVPAFGLGLRL